MPESLAIITVNWNQTESTCRCLRSLASFESLKPEIWVVDNASTDGGADAIAAEFPRVHLIANSANLGFGAANNQALRRTRASTVLLLNNDSFIPEADLERLNEALEADPRLAAVGPALIAGPESDEVISLGGRDILRHSRTHLKPSDWDSDPMREGRLLPVRYIPGAIALLRSEVVKKAGYFEEDYFFGGELADFCETASSLGYSTAVLPTAHGWHDMSESGNLRRTLYPYYILRNRFLFMRRHRRRALLPLLALGTGYGLARAARSLLAGDTNRARLSLLAVADGLRGRFGNQHQRVLR